ncbi:uncharacterized protein EV154DRAFT_183041 [Mucor mucedo]|uniref:uncharacterized protein n=1 Tax=Mucor mucedo TaxID=29922 RepID=UPI00222063A7|nr:uncharacterized protein EV154DRAFT_183041 [Mucor mucedo]KAI7892762.1 hypothetical protein EV154DRAFT_183041 [Mucor mucedo]
MQRHIDVPSARRSVQISSLPETITAQKRSSEAKTIVSRYSQRLPSTLRRASVEESSSVTPPLDSLLSRYSTKTQDSAAETHHIQRKDVTASSRYSQRRLSAENTSKNQIQNTVAESSTAASRYTQRRSSNEDNSKTITSRYSQRRLSTDHTDTKPKVETKRYEPRQSTTTATHPKPRDLSTVTSRYSQRRLSIEKAIDIKPKLEQKRPDLRYPTTTETRKPKLPTRDISTISSRYCQRRLSTENTDTKNAEITRSRATSIRLEPARTNTYQSQSNRNSFVPNEATKDAEPIETRRYSTRGRLTTTATSTNTRDAEKYVPNDTKHHQAGITVTRKLSLRDRTLTSNRMNDLTKHPSEATPRDTGQNQAGSSRTRRVSFNLDEPSHENPSDKHPTLNINKRDSYHGSYDEQVNVKVTPPRRPRSFSVPNNEERHSLLPVLSTRVRKYSNPKPETVREEEIMSSRSKEKRPFVNTQQLMSPSHSIGSSISTDSTQSGDFDAGPATPPRYSYMEHQQVRPASKPISQSVSAVLLQVKQSRARTAAIINGMYK